MSLARRKVTLTNLSEFSRLMPKVPRDQVIEEMADLSLECSLAYALGKTFLRDGWIAEYRHLHAAAHLSPCTDLLLFATSGSLDLELADGSQIHVMHGDQVVLRAATEAKVFPVSDEGDVSFLALAIDLNLTEVLQDLVVDSDLPKRP
ncbi:MULTISPECIES: hypothetical protein [Pseudomonas]|uniref:Uncharacterized protein n=1 Tax=Pseudomonas vlassakiae TaxID=485888 RepID=A0A923GKK8_9PSED|nr:MULTISPECIES: hypothetical protein [Pseudomonas]MBH3412807.1 hypothetical protein [Pseudomonas putida]MBV4541204.1 hypothetical protein [Pseudomonas vlassakiae]